MTTFRGLRIHQGKTKCGGYGEAQSFTSLTSPTQSWMAPQTPSMKHKQLEESASLQSLQQTYGILGISLQDELQQGTQSSDWTWSQRTAAKVPSVTAAQPLRSVLELRGQIYTEERTLGEGPLAALKAPPAQTHRDELEKLKKENEFLKTRCEEFNAAKVKLTAAMKALERQYGELKSRYNELKASRESLDSEMKILKQENENLKHRHLAKTKEKEKVKIIKQALPPCGICGHYITQMYNDFLTKRPEQAYKPPCQQCDDGFVQLYQDYLKAKQLENDYKTPCEQCREEYTSLCFENLAVRFPDTATLQSCQDCGHNFKQLAEILQIPTENASERTRANTSSEDTSDPCSETELKKEFDQLKQEFPKALKSINSQNYSQEALKVKLQWTLDIAKRDTMKKQKDLQNIFPADGKNKTPALLQLTFSNLQTALHNCSDSYYHSMIQEFIKDEPKEVSALLVKWYRLSCLMVLHNPPLLPKWDTDGFPCSIDREKVQDDSTGLRRRPKQ